MHDNNRSLSVSPSGSAEVKPRTLVDGQSKSATKSGIVIGCKSLLIRAKPDKNAAIVTVISAGSEVVIDKDLSTDQFYKVCNNAGAEGFCMKRYIRLRP